MRDILRDSLDELSITYDDERISKLNKFYEMLVEKNKVINLTTITEYDDVVVKHFADSLAVVKYILIKEGMRALDLGTGAGFPGIPLAIFYPRTEFVLLDSVNKKLKFINEVKTELGLDNVSVVHGRAEKLAHTEMYREKFDLIFSRAVSNMSTLAELSLGFLKTDGCFVAYKSEETDAEIADAAKAIRLMGGELGKEISIKLPYTEINRMLYLINKVSKTPNRYPRKAGDPKRNPIR